MSVVWDEAEGCKVKARDGAIKFGQLVGSVASLLHHYHRP